jgi:hypothetical protein
MADDLGKATPRQASDAAKKLRDAALSRVRKKDSPANIAALHQAQADYDVAHARLVNSMSPNAKAPR